MTEPVPLMAADDPALGDARRRILTAAADLLTKGGRDALTTRGVAAAAGVQAPTLYRLFGDKRGLLDATAEQSLATYVAGKATVAAHVDPLTEFRAGWDRHVAFGLAHPALFAIIAGDPRPDKVSPATAAGQAALRNKIRRLATAGLLRVSEDRAAGLTQAACTGVVLTLLDTPAEARDPELAAASREAIIAAITSTVPAADRPGPAGAAIALRASLDQTTSLTPGERHLLTELLDRLASDAFS